MSIELLMEGREGLKSLMLRFLNRCWEESRVPEGWGRSIIVPIYKGKGDAGNCKNYRGISLMDHMAKLYERILERKLRSKIEPRLGEEQYGYRGGRSTTDLMFALRMIQKKTWEYNKKAYIAFIDLKKAFDSVPREKLWRVLERDYEVDDRLIRAVRSTYVNSLSRRRTGYKNEEWFEVKTGVRQGSVLSPILFIAYLDTVIRGVKESLEEIDGDIMVYADDLACWSGDGERLRQMVLCFAEKLREAGLNMNVEKTEIMIVSREEEEEEEELIVEVDGREIKNVDRYK